MTKYKVSDYPAYIRDSYSNGVINTNTSEYENYMKIQENALSRERMMQSEINTIKSELFEIRSLLTQLTKEKK
ncbi:hypothetical protein EBU71_01360 [bacterium]|nr:hypothetical protein [Candidatus Elulimicrobium humile]